MPHARWMMRGTAAFMVALAAASSPVTAQAPVPFVVGVWGQGDAVIPFADFDGERWRSSWPPPIEDDPAPRTLRRIPAAWWGRATFQPAWELLEAKGSRRTIQITGTAPAGLGSSCSTNLGLTTDVSADTYEYSTVLATSHSGVLDPVETLASTSADWRTISTLLPDIYRRYEAAGWKDVSASFRPDLSAPLSNPKLGQAFVFRDELGEYAYFESTREFAARPEQQGSERSFIAGWLWRAMPTGLFQLVTVEPATNDGEGKGPNSFRPLAVVRHGGRRFWIGSLGAYAYSGMTVFDVRRGGVKELLRVDYPGC